MTNNFNKCDVCGIESDDVKAGRWIFYCPKHKQVDIDKTYDNEVKPDIENGDLSNLLNDGELSDIVEKLF